jgi:octaprenyl-diphosphate synthase
MDFKAISDMMADDMAAIDELIIKRLSSDVALVNQLSYYIINAGGKRLRPMLVALCARALNYNGTDHHNLAAVIEFIHTATLLHDDVVDESDMRRGQETANEVFGNAASVLVGDFLYSRAFQMMVEVNQMPVMSVLSNATNTIAEGEVLQLMNCNDADTSIERYLDVIRYKTATLFAAGCQIGAIIAKAEQNVEQALTAYGLHLGNAFQLIDDALDYMADEHELGKNLGDDLAEGKPTLPLILAMQRGTEQQASIIREAIEQGSAEMLSEITQIIKSTGSLEATIEAAEQEITKAKSALSLLADSEYKQALLAIAELSLKRSH